MFFADFCIFILGGISGSGSGSGSGCGSGSGSGVSAGGAGVVKPTLGAGLTVFTFFSVIFESFFSIGLKAIFPQSFMTHTSKYRPSVPFCSPKYMAASYPLQVLALRA